MGCTKEDTRKFKNKFSGVNKAFHTLLTIKKRIIIKLVRWKKWRASHTENIIGGLPSHLKGSKDTKQALKELEKAEWIISSKKTGEIHYSLNPEKTEEILKFYEEYCKK